MAIGLTNAEFGLGLRFNHQVDRIHAQAQHIIDQQDATIDALRDRVRELEAQLEAERSARKVVEFKLRRRSI